MRKAWTARRAWLPLVIVALGLTMPRATAQTTEVWHHQTPVPAASANAVDLISAAEGWAASTTGVGILHTTDGGLTWSTQSTPVSENLEAIRFMDALHGWAAGDNSLLYTTDGGATWVKGKSFTATNYGVDYADALHVWAVGIGGIVYRTVDGGKNWTWKTTPTSQNLKDVDFVDLNNGWAAGANGAIIRTTDGGNTWTMVPSGTNAFLDGVSFVSAREGWVAGGDVFLHTADGGATWTPESVPPGTWVHSLGFLDGSKGWAAGEPQNIVHTANGGTTWTTQLSATPDGNRGRLWGIDFGDATHGVAVGEDSILSTSDGGATWVDRVSGTGNEVLDIAATDTNHAWAAHFGGAVSWTTDGGAWWYTTFPGNRYGSLSGVAFAGIDFVNNRTGWVAGDIGSPYYNGVVMKTTDGGVTWQQQYLATGGLTQLYDIDAVNASIIVAVGNQGIIRSTDGGVTWMNIPNPSAAILSAVKFIGRTGWIAGNGGAILLSKDSGATWQLSPQHIVADDLTDISFASDKRNGWATGFGDGLLHSTDGGKSWVQQEPGGSFFTNMVSVSAVSSTTAWVTGTQAFVAKTTDGGATWVIQDMGTSPLNSVAASRFIDADYGWIGGSATPPGGGIWLHTP